MNTCIKNVLIFVFASAAVVMTHSSVNFSFMLRDKQVMQMSNMMYKYFVTASRLLEIIRHPLYHRKYVVAS